MRSPQRGEVWLVDLGMAAKVRPAVVISVPADDTDRALVTLVRSGWLGFTRTFCAGVESDRDLRVGPEKGYVALALPL